MALLALAAQVSGAPRGRRPRQGAVLEGAAGGARLVSPVNGYHGYVEPAERVMTGRGESPRQIFSPALLDVLRAAAASVGAAAPP